MARSLFEITLFLCVITETLRKTSDLWEFREGLKGYLKAA